MILHEIGDIKRNGILIPGGWRAQVIEVTPESAAFELYLPVLNAMGFTQEKASQIILKMVQDIYSGGYLHKLRMSVAGYAEKYAKMFPHLTSVDYDVALLRGFNPEVAQRYYLPSIGGGKDSGIEDELRRMAANV